MTEIMTDGPATRLRVANVGLNNPDRLVFPKPKVTRRMVADYYEAMADRVLEGARNRPLSLLRLPDGLEGQQFFQKHRGKGFPDAIKALPLQDSTGEIQDKMYLSTPASLIAAVQMDTIEFHIEGVRTDRAQTPDRLVFDLDPDEGMGFPLVRDAAALIRDLLSEVGLPSWAMVSGGRAVHVVVPLRRSASTQTVALFSRVFATLLAERRPRNFTAKTSKVDRRGRIFIDWMHNDAGSTAIAPFSLRARAGAPVAVPVGWDELRLLRRANGFSLKDALARDWLAIGKIKPGNLSARSLGALDGLLADL